MVPECLSHAEQDDLAPVDVAENHRCVDLKGTAALLVFKVQLLSVVVEQLRL